jgi:hypothetical protein
MTEEEYTILQRAVDRMGWDEIRAFYAERAKGQSIREDAGGFAMRALGRLFGVKPIEDVVSYQDAARAMIETMKARES